MRKQNDFTKPEATIIQFAAEDVIVTSVMGILDEDDPVEQPQD